MEEFVDDEIVDDENLDEEIVEELIAPFDNDSAANPAVDEFLSITNTREIVYTDQISAEDGDDEDFVQFVPEQQQPQPEDRDRNRLRCLRGRIRVRTRRAAQRRRQRYDAHHRRPDRLQ